MHRQYFTLASLKFYRLELLDFMYARKFYIKCDYHKSCYVLFEHARRHC